MKRKSVDWTKVSSKSTKKFQSDQKSLAEKVEGKGRCFRYRPSCNVNSEQK